ncbi:hypothetical protein N7466_007281 [Penicillium verhagenii]|uniref:uncharacterized protein n=1 Tax=Penicillium verhagenii TaxID=1562060 RepID=UPI0025459F60|nr:uncharacterized protein N7466_007281 [Penicillium verhagenii]KAJ5928325.1 hypothetical protein N7466_007281 [Penicillium verhagenii]
MPTTVSFEPIVVRNLHDDENLVLGDFESHVARCNHCALAIETSENYHCERGYLLALDVTKYLYTEGGKTFAAVDRDNGKPRRVKLPRDSSATRSLLVSIEKGVRLQSPRRGRAPAVQRLSPVISHTRPMPVIEQSLPRALTPEPQSPPLQIIERSPSITKRHVIVYPRSSRQSSRSSNASSRSSSNRGSLYIPDHLDREDRRYETRGHRYHR